MTRPSATVSHLKPSDHQEVTMNRTRRLWPIRPLACILAGQAAALLAAVAATRAALPCLYPRG